MAKEFGKDQTKRILIVSTMTHMLANGRMERLQGMASTLGGTETDLKDSGKLA